jgi:hypothetical protein
VILGTPAGRCRGDLEADDLAELSLDGAPRDTLGWTLEQALHRLETLEHGARILLAARQIGTVNELPPQSAAALRLLHATLRSSR